MDVGFAGEVAAAAVIPVFASVANLDTAWFEHLPNGYVSANIE